MRQDRRQAAEPPAPTGNPRQDRENSRSNRIPREPGYLARDLTSQRAAIGDYRRQAEEKPPGLARPRKGWPGPGCMHPDAHSKDRVSDALPAASSSGAMAVLERRPPSISGHDGSGPGGGSRPVMAAMAGARRWTAVSQSGAADGLGLAVPAALAGRETPPGTGPGRMPGESGGLQVVGVLADRNPAARRRARHQGIPWRR